MQRGGGGGREARGKGRSGRRAGGGGRREDRGKEGAVRSGAVMQTADHMSTDLFTNWSGARRRGRREERSERERNRRERRGEAQSALAAVCRTSRKRWGAAFHGNTTEAHWLADWLTAGGTHPCPPLCLSIIGHGRFSQPWEEDSDVEVWRREESVTEERQTEQEEPHNEDLKRRQS